jgi:preprotein translocase subunit SecE
VLGVSYIAFSYQLPAKLYHLDIYIPFLIYLTKCPPKLEDFFMPSLNIFVFLKEVREELVKVSWPSREQTIRYTVLVIAVAVAVGVFLGVLDYLLTLLTTFLINLR